jgi:subtilisin family serine protease
MRRVRLAAALLVALALPVAPVAPSRAAGPAGEPMVKAVVVLRSQADLTLARAVRRKSRPGAAARILRAHADRAQRGLRDLLRHRRAQGLVASAEPLWIIDAVAVTAAPSVIRELAARPEVREVRPDLTVPAPQAGVAAADAAVEANLDVVNTRALWERGYRGHGVVVANMDTGVDVSHPDLAARWRGGTNSWYDPSGQHPSVPTDVNGHGTWTMGVMVGGGAGGSAVGVAPEATWIAAKVFNDQGVASATRIHQAFQWLLDPDGDPGTADAPDVVNNSWTMATTGCLLDFQPDLAALRTAGILPVFAAGNYGPLDGSARSPADNLEAFAVGAVDDADVVDGSSGRGPSACGQPVYPRLVAPGVGVRTTDLYGGYAEESGTSVAAPHVAGALALLLQAYADLPAERQAVALEAGATDLGPPGPDDAYGHGRLDVLTAYEWLRTAPDLVVGVSPASASAPPGGAVTYPVSLAAVNGFDGEVTLSATGLPAQTAWEFAPSVVPAVGGSALLTVTTDASIPAGTYPFTIRAASGATVRTASAMLIVLAPPDFALSVSPPFRSVAAGGTVTYSIGVAALNGFTREVGLSVSGLPATVGTAAFAPPAVSGAGTSQLTITTLPGSPAGRFALTITGTSGPLTRQTSVRLQVR